MQGIALLLDTGLGCEGDAFPALGAIHVESHDLAGATPLGLECQIAAGRTHVQHSLAAKVGSCEVRDDCGAKIPVTLYFACRPQGERVVKLTVFPPEASHRSGV